MYRNCKKCCAFNNHMATFNEDAIETRKGQGYILK